MIVVLSLRSVIGTAFRPTDRAHMPLRVGDWEDGRAERSGHILHFQNGIHQLSKYSLEIIMYDVDKVDISPGCISGS